MALYVLKTFDPSGRVVGREQFRAPGDQEAVATMQYLYEKRWCELWCGSRKVRVWDGAVAGRRRADRPAAALPPKTAPPPAQRQA